MTDIQNRIVRLLEATDNWLFSDNHYLADAVDRTVQEGYFSYQDVRYALDGLRASIRKEHIEQWVNAAGMSKNRNAAGENVLCLHAGNLPLVGFQDAFATLLSGARYTAKISRKEPYLLPTFLNEVKKTPLWTDMDVQWSHRLDDFEDMPHDRILFAGSESSVPGVKEAIRDLHLAKEDAHFLIRTAHFSMAYLDTMETTSLQELVEGMLRYGGKGCRSVAVVVAPFPLSRVKDEIQEKAEAFWTENPQHQMPPPKLEQRYAYNEAIGRDQLWQNYFLLQEGGLELDQDFICYWMEGDESEAGELARKFGSRMQSLYLPDPDNPIPDYDGETEMLSHAQQPPLSWKPDGVDTLAWLVN